MGIKHMQIPHTHTLRSCPNLPLALVLPREADSHVAETFSPALRVLSARCLSLANQHQPNWTHCDDSRKGLEAHSSSKSNSLATLTGHILIKVCALLTIFTLLVFNELYINTSVERKEGRSMVWQGTTTIHVTDTPASSGTQGYTLLHCQTTQSVRQQTSMHQVYLQ